ncbi:MAG: hypothetical protein HYY31_00630 [Chloroflexi bacterium]|nr:hypothetical protein [Chloroflexota bacterium]
MSRLAFDYLLLVCLASGGVLQFAAAYGRFCGLFLLPGRLLSATLGFAMVAFGFIWFFLPGPRHIIDSSGGLDGPTQAGLFTGGASLAVLLTLALSSVVNWKRFPASRPESCGLEGLRQATFFRAFLFGVKDLWKHFPGWTRRSSSGLTAG